MKWHYLVKPAIFIFASFLYLMRGMEAKAEETVDMNTSIGGMGLAIEEYYEDRLSESGISISNVTTTFYVNGEKLEAIQRGPSPYEGLVFSNTQDFVNIRMQPNTSSEITGKLYRGSVAKMLEQTGEWTKILSGKVEGYIKSDYLLYGEEAKALAEDSCTRYIKATCQTLNVRAGQGTNHKIITQIAEGSMYEIVQIYDEWIEIILDTDDDTGKDYTAFVCKDYADVIYEFKYAVSTEEERVEKERAAAARRAEEERLAKLEEEKKKKAESSAKSSASDKTAEIETLTSSGNGSEIAEYACKFIGNPYVWGGTSLTNGADCSGFVQSVFKHFGISLTRVSKDQARTAGKQIELSLSSLKPGDLIFYGNSSRKVNHVAIYIGDGNIVHAMGKKFGIRISSYNYRTPLLARRVVK